MINDQEYDEIETLEKQLLDNEVSIEEMARRYAIFLKRAVSEGVLDGVASRDDLDLASKYIDRAIRTNNLRGRVDRESCLVELWRLEKERRFAGAEFVALIRCIILCFATEEKWEDDNSGEDTPVYFFFFFLDKVLPKLKSSLMEHFRHWKRL